MHITRHTLLKLVKEEINNVLREFKAPDSEEVIQDLKQEALRLAPQVESSVKISEEHLQLLRNIRTEQDLLSLFGEVEEILKNGNVNLNGLNEDKYRYNPLAIIIAIIHHSVTDRGTKSPSPMLMVYPMALIAGSVMAIASGDLTGVSGLVFVALCYKYWSEIDNLPGGEK